MNKKQFLVTVEHNYSFGNKYQDYLVEANDADHAQRLVKLRGYRVAPCDILEQDEYAASLNIVPKLPE